MLYFLYFFPFKDSYSFFFLFLVFKKEIGENSGGDPIPDGDWDSLLRRIGDGGRDGGWLWRRGRGWRLQTRPRPVAIPILTIDYIEIKAFLKSTC